MSHSRKEKADMSVRTLLANNQIIRIKNASSYPAELILLFHGYTGNENSMDIFHNKIPDQYACLSPRAFFKLDDGQYSWVDPQSIDSKLTQYVSSAVEIHHNINNWISYLDGRINSISVAGFSQGAALAYVYLALYPQEIDRVIGLSGFLPDGYENKFSKLHLSGKRIFLSHGSKDTIVPFEKSEQTAAFFTQASAEVEFCTALVQHKLSLACFNLLNSFLDH